MASSSRMMWDAIVGRLWDSGQFIFAKSESPQWPEEVIILKKNGLTQPQRNTTIASDPYAGLCSAFDLPHISFPTSSSAARKYDFVFGNTTEIILEIQLRLSVVLG